MVAGSRCFPLCVCFLEELDNSKQEMHRATYMLGISATAWCLPLLLTRTHLHICPERWDGSAPIRALELTQFRACPLCWQSLCHLTTQLWLSLTHSNRRVWAQKATTESPLPHSAFFGGRKFREKTKHLSILVFWPLDLPLKGRAVSWWLGQNHCRTRRLESIYIYIFLLKTWRIIWFEF